MLTGALAGVFLSLIALLVISQIVGRILGLQVRSAIDFATFSLAAFIFLGLAYTHRSGAHIRVTLLIRLFPPKLRHAIEMLNVAAALTLFSFFTYYSVQMTIQSYEFGSVSIGIVPFPLFIPQAGMALGLLMMSVAVVQDLLALATGKTPSYLAIDS
jgi:TRAP-type C4-dicarboxylate transport system permease small subunit